jgi:adenylosuccinate synthase
MGERLRKTGSEYGTTTGRERRTGWFDAVVARYATRVNGITDYFITKLDVLTGVEKVPVCVAYDIGGTRQDEMPMTQTDLHHAKPIYEYLDGWWEDISSARRLSDLPAGARAYLGALEELIGAPVAAVGVGPRRDQTLQVRSVI